MAGEVQSVVFKRGERTKKEQRTWLAKHGFTPVYPGKSVPDENATQVRYRQADPKKYRRYTTLQVRPDIAFIMGYR